MPSAPPPPSSVASNTTVPASLICTRSNLSNAPALLAICVNERDSP
jgi:hypothetical protein